jgi:phosphoribosylformylglycinamidine synthase
LPLLKSWFVRVFYKKGFVDPLGQIIENDVSDLGIASVEEVRSLPKYIIKGSVEKEGVEKACKELLADPVTQSYMINGEYRLDQGWVIEVDLKPGVTDFVGESVMKGLGAIGVEGVETVKTGITYLVKGSVNKEEVEYLCLKCIVNPLIHDFHFTG